MFSLSLIYSGFDGCELKPFTISHKSNTISCTQIARVNITSSFSLNINIQALGNNNPAPMNARAKTQITPIFLLVFFSSARKKKNQQ